MKVALYYRHLAPTDRETMNTLLRILQESRIETAVVGETDEVQSFDMLLSIGGDGTLLSTLQLDHGQGQLPPVLGINFGHLGFLTSAPKDDLAAIASDLLAGNYSVEPRTLLQWQQADDPATAAEPQTALNEVFLHRSEDNSLLRTEVYVNGDYVATYSGDGVIVATPTGSTAYSLSCGGPILTPDSNTLIITPIAPHTLSLRPIILPDSATIRLETTGGNLILGADSRRVPLHEPLCLRISKAPFALRLIRTGSQNFFSAMREKLMWGTDIRPN